MGHPSAMSASIVESGRLARGSVRTGTSQERSLEPARHGNGLSLCNIAFGGNIKPRMIGERVFQAVAGNRGEPSGESRLNGRWTSS